MIEKQKTIEVAIKNMVNSHMKSYSRDLILCAEILNQITEKGYVFDYTRFSMDDQKLVSDIAYQIFRMEEMVNCVIKSERNNQHYADEDIGELYCGDDEPGQPEKEDEPKFEFDDIGDFFPITDNCDSLSEVLSCMEIPHIIFDGTGYCFNGNYYSIVDSGIDRMVLKVTRIQESDIDPLCLEILKNQI
ncbi:MAG: hypothetical protein PHV71_08355 [Eubacteriales bacterium]|nr:hypothetical protein [Eubacteriales bacterium]